MSPETPVTPPVRPRTALVAGIRMALALLGFMLALLAIAFDDHRLGWAGIVLLAGSLLLRLAQRPDRTV
jgi:hypothetical protein